MKTYPVSKSIRDRLKKPLGRLIPAKLVSSDSVLKAVHGSQLIVAVGDRTTESLISLGVTPSVSVVDGREMRVPRVIPKTIAATTSRVRNPTGTISEESLRAVQESLRLPLPLQIIVDGEEDLLALLFIAFYPSGSVVLYGQPHEGLVVVKVRSASKLAAARTLKEIGMDG